MELPIEGKIVVKIGKETIIIDKKNFSPCEGKEIEEWSWKKMKMEKWVVHVDRKGTITKEKISVS